MNDSRCWLNFISRMAVSAAIVTGVPEAALAQSPKQAAPDTQSAPARQHPLVLRAVPLGQTDGPRLVQELQNLMPAELRQRVRLVDDPSTNTLFISGDAQDIALIAGFAEQMDRQRSNAPAKQEALRVLSLNGLESTDAFERGLRTILPTHVALDRERGVLIVPGDEHVVHAVQAYLDEYRKVLQDRQPPPRVRLRLVWLASNAPPEVTTALPEDLKDVTKELAGIGVTDLHLLCQFAVTIATGSHFEIKGATPVGGATLTAGGALSQAIGDLSALELSLAVRSTRSQANSTMCELSSRTTIRRGQYLVLGVTPMNKATSVFVVQLLPAAEAGR